ncbi:MAG: uracil-DNA glycosylase [Parvularculaceae bacterium]
MATDRPDDATSTAGLRALLRWYAEAGVDVAVADAPTDFFAEKPAPPAERPVPRLDAPAARPDRPPRPAAQAPNAGTAAVDAREAPAPVDEAIAAAVAAADAAADLDALAAAVAEFDGCPLKAGARNAVFADGAAGADLIVVGEAPGRDEDRLGRPFVGRAGALLDRMLAAIGRSRAENALIVNVVFWRPPGNRTPTHAETAVCRPFVDRLIDLARPKALLLVGGAPTHAILGLSGVMRHRGAWRDATTRTGTVVPALPTLHPAYLLRQPAQTRLAWRDLQTLAARLDGQARAGAIGPSASRRDDV